MRRPTLALGINEIFRNDGRPYSEEEAGFIRQTIGRL